MTEVLGSDDERFQRLHALGVIRLEVSRPVAHRPLFNAMSPIVQLPGYVDVTAGFASGGELRFRVNDDQDVWARLEELCKRPDPEPAAAVEARRTGKALGFRSWRLQGYALWSANEKCGSWKIGEPTEARCAAVDNWVWEGTQYNHEAPAHNCQCGLYALHSPEFMSRWHGHDPMMVHGAVLGWGRMEVHHEGWRAQYAQPVMLAIDGERQPYNHVKRIQALGAELGLPVVEWGEYESEAKKLGEVVPEELRPEDRWGPSNLHPALVRLRQASMRIQQSLPICSKCGVSIAAQLLASVKDVRTCPCGGTFG